MDLVVAVLAEHGVRHAFILPLMCPHCGDKAMVMCPFRSRSDQAVRHDALVITRQPKKQYYPWPNAARALAITLVVLHHSVQYSVSSGIAPEWWDWTTEMLRTLRMPLFFMAAGLFAGKWATQSWPSLLRSKIMVLMWVYVLWVFVRAAWFYIVPGGGVREAAPITELLARIVWPLPGWFLFTLAGLFLILRLTYSTSQRWQIVSLVIAAVVSALWLGGVSVGNLGWDGMPTYYFFFLVGVLGASQLLPRVPKMNPVARLLVVASWIVLYVLAYALNLVDTFGVSFLLRVVGLCAGIVIAASLTWVPGIKTLGDGKSTLPIYVTHLLIVIPLVAALARVDALARVPLFGSVVPLGIAALAMCLSFTAGVLAPKLHLGWLYATPRWLDRLAGTTRTKAITPQP